MNIIMIFITINNILIVIIITIITIVTMIVITIIIKLIIFLPGRAGLGEECSSSLQCQLEQVDNVPFLFC